MRHPDKVDVALLGLLRQGADVVLRQNAALALVLGDGRGIFLVPQAQMVRVALRSIDEDVHLVLLGEFKPVEAGLHGPRIAVEPFDHAAVLLIRIVLKQDGGIFAVHGLGKHLLQGSDGVECRVVVLAQQQDVVRSVQLDNFHVELVLALGEHVARDIVGSRVVVRRFPGAVDADVQVGCALNSRIAVAVGQASLGEDLFQARLRNLTDAGLHDDVDRFGDGHVLFAQRHLLRERIHLVFHLALRFAAHIGRVGDLFGARAKGDGRRQGDVGALFRRGHGDCPGLGVDGKQVAVTGPGNLHAFVGSNRKGEVVVYDRRYRNPCNGVVHHFLIGKVVDFKTPSQVSAGAWVQYSRT